MNNLNNIQKKLDITKITSKNGYLQLVDVFKNRIEPIVFPISVLSFLGMWISMSYNSQLFFEEAIVCSSIIASITFFRVAEQNGDLPKDYSSKKLSA